MIPFQKTYQWYVYAVVSLTAVHGGILVTMAVCSASNHWWTYTTEGILGESFLHVSTMSHQVQKKPARTHQNFSKINIELKPNFPSPNSFCRSDLCPKQSWAKDLVRPDGLFAMPLHGGWLNGPWVLESSMRYISSDSVFLPHRSEFCWILTKKPEFSRMSHMNQLGLWRSGCGLWFGQSWDHWDHQAAASDALRVSAALVHQMFHIL